jgi:Tol biopolymer transport system component
VADKTRTRLTSTAGYDGMAKWSPDGRAIAFVSARTPPEALYVMEASGARVRRLTTAQVLDPAWSQ